MTQNQKNQKPENSEDQKRPQDCNRDQSKNFSRLTFISIFEPSRRPKASNSVRTPGSSPTSTTSARSATGSSFSPSYRKTSEMIFLPTDLFSLFLALDVTANCICEIRRLALDGFDINTVHKLRSKEKKISAEPGFEPRAAGLPNTPPPLPPHR